MPPLLLTQKLRLGPLDSPFFDKSIEYTVPADCKVQHLWLRSARLGDKWKFLPEITTLRTLDLTNSDVPGKSHSLYCSCGIPGPLKAC